MATNLLFYGYFTASKAGKTGLTVTVDVDKIEKATGTRTVVVTGGSATEGRRGYYYYLLSNATPLTHDYPAIFITADSSVDQQEVAAVRVDFTEARATELANLDAAVSTRLAAADYAAPTTPPTAGAIADAVWDEAMADHTTAGTTGAQLSAAGAAGDPLLGEVPGDYDPGTAGWALGRISAGSITTVSPTSQSGDITVDIGYDHADADGRAFEWTDEDGTWVDLTGATAQLVIAGQIEAACSIVNAGTASQSILCELTAAQTVTLKPGKWAFVVDVTRGGRLLKQITGWSTHVARVTA